VSHVVHHIGFGTSLNKRTKQKLSKVPEEYRTVSPMNGNVYKTDKLHTAHHHHLYVVPTKHLNPSDASLGERVLGTFVLARLSNFARAFTSPFSRSASFNYHQLSYQSQLIEFPEDKVPAVTFAYVGGAGMGDGGDGGGGKRARMRARKVRVERALRVCWSAPPFPRGERIPMVEEESARIQNRCPRTNSCLL
jgi:hypothetical protein